MKFTTLCILLPFFSFSQSMHHPPDTGTSTKNVFTTIMHEMMMKMDEVNQTEFADKDFLQMMIPHHKGAIEMAEYEILHGSNPEMIQLAKSIKTEQQIQIQQMQLLLFNSKSFGITGIKHIEPNKQMMITMMNKMKPMGTTIDIDRAFALTMIPHHQAAIEMAKVELQYGLDQSSKRLAEMIISDEQIEIDQMKKIK